MTYKKNNKRVPKFHYYSNVKKTFEEHLIDILKQPIYLKIKEICDASKSKNNQKTIKAFQHSMKNIKTWDYSELKAAYRFVTSKSKSSYLPKLVNAVIISNIKFIGSK